MNESKLQHAMDRLESIVESVEERLLEQMPYLDVPIEKVRDASGRYILMDAYTALVNGYAALENMERARDR